MLADRIGAGAHGMRRLSCARIRMDADMAEVGTEARFEIGPALRIERQAWRGQCLMHRMRRFGERVCRTGMFRLHSPVGKDTAGRGRRTETLAAAHSHDVIGEAVGLVLKRIIGATDRQLRGLRRSDS
jgi:hypothetical protein